MSKLMSNASYRPELLDMFLPPDEEEEVRCELFMDPLCAMSPLWDGTRGEVTDEW
jgi:hypothetical protein